MSRPARPMTTPVAKLYENPKARGDLHQRISRLRTSGREPRGIHRKLLQSMPFTFSIRLPSTRRVRTTIRKRKRASCPGSSDHNHYQMESSSYRLRDTVPIILSQPGVHPPRFQFKMYLSCAKTVPKPYPIVMSGFTSSEKQIPRNC